MAKTNVTSDVIKLKNVRLSFPVIWQPKSFEKDREAKFQATFLLDPSDEAHAGMIKQIKIAAKKVLTEAFGDVPMGAMKKCFGLADKHAKKSQYDGYKGMFYISSGNSTRPTLVDRKRQDLEESDGVLYAGCYVNTNITLWTFDHPVGGQGVAANLRIIQFVKDGEAFGNAPAKADEELDDVDIDDDDGATDDWDDEDDDDLD
jgi:hypothetical protein